MSYKTIFLSIIILVLLYILCVFITQTNIRETFQSMYVWNKCGLNQNKLVQTFLTKGCIIIPNVLSEKECDELLKIIEREEHKSIHETGNINSGHKRKDLMLPIGQTKSYIRNIYEKIRGFCDQITPSARIVENSSLISYPGCYPQVWHSDTTFKSDKEANLVSFGVALDDVTNNMGPLEVFLKSNGIYKDKIKLLQDPKFRSEDLDGSYDDGLKYQKHEELCKKLRFEHGKCACKKGSLVIWSSKIIHRGGANTSKKRPIFYFSLVGEGTRPSGATYSLKSKDPILSIKKI